MLLKNPMEKIFVKGIGKIWGIRYAFVKGIRSRVGWGRGSGRCQRDMKGYRRGREGGVCWGIEGYVFYGRSLRGKGNSQIMKFIKLSNKSFLKIKSDQIDSINLFFIYNLDFTVIPQKTLPFSSTLLPPRTHFRFFRQIWVVGGRNYKYNFTL